MPTDSFPGQMPSSFDDAEVYNERPLHKIVRKIKEEPLVPLGMGLTVFAFVNAYRALRKGDSRQANRMFRARVAAQGFTVIAMVAGSMYYSKDREKTKELRKLQEERSAEERRQKWIRELEARDEEETAIKERLQKKVAAKAAAVAGGQGDAANSGSTGGVLGKIGLWPTNEKAAELLESSTDKKEKKENNQSSLGAIGEVISSSKK